MEVDIQTTFSLSCYNSLAAFITIRPTPLEADFSPHFLYLTSVLLFIQASEKRHFLIKSLSLVFTVKGTRIRIKSNYVVAIMHFEMLWCWLIWSKYSRSLKSGFIISVMSTFPPPVIRLSSQDHYQHLHFNFSPTLKVIHVSKWKTHTIPTTRVNVFKNPGKRV